MQVPTLIYALRPGHKLTSCEKTFRSLVGLPWSHLRFSHWRLTLTFVSLLRARIGFQIFRIQLTDFTDDKNTDQPMSIQGPPSPVTRHRSQSIAGMYPYPKPTVEYGVSEPTWMLPRRQIRRGSVPSPPKATCDPSDVEREDVRSGGSIRMATCRKWLLLLVALAVLTGCCAQTCWAACLDDQGTLESPKGSVFLSVSSFLVLCLVI